jgi:NAD(P)-dependent dehydrogenase (short-subunit alcohol dehydrogenase family)
MAALSGKVAIVTGATSGIGERIAELFVEEGAKVVAAARREKEGAALEQRLGVSFIRTDISNEADVKAAVDYALTKFGQIDCLVNNAGAPSPMVSIVDSDAAALDHAMATNVRGAFLMMKYVAPTMLARGQGSIINISSVAGLRGGLSGHVYTASKGALLALSRSVAAELGEKGVCVNSISPGAIVTGIFGKNAGVEGAKAERLTDSVREIFAKVQPIPRAGETDDVARAALFLASDAGSFISGQDLVIDGGLTAGVRGWSTMAAARAQMSERIKAAASKL